MNKYQEALNTIQKNTDDGIDEHTGEAIGSYVQTEIDTLQELVDKETPKKPKIVKLFGEEASTCPADGCGVGLDPSESIWHKASYCGNCGQKIDWSDEG